jgi:hypothetical protein
MAIGDVYQLTDVQSLFGIEVLNVYYYKALTGGTTAGKLAASFNLILRPEIIKCQVDNITHVNTVVLNLDDVTDFDDIPANPAVAGQQVDQSSPSFVTWTFKLNRSDRTVRNGRKAIAGVGETFTGGNGPTAGQLTILDAVAPFFAQVLVDGDGDEYQPVIYGKPTGPPSNLPLRVVDVASAQFVRLSSQNSRKS